MRTIRASIPSVVRAKLAQLGQRSPITSADFSLCAKERKIIFLGVKIPGVKLSEERSDIFRRNRQLYHGRFYNSIGTRAEISGTTIVTPVIVFPESSDKGEFYSHVGHHFVSCRGISDIFV